MLDWTVVIALSLSSAQVPETSDRPALPPAVEKAAEQLADEAHALIRESKFAEAVEAALELRDVCEEHLPDDWYVVIDARWLHQHVLHVSQLPAEEREELGRGRNERIGAIRGALGAGRSQDAVRSTEELLESHRRILGRGDRLTLDALEWHSVACGAAGRLEEQESALRELVRGRTELLGRDHSETLRAAHRLAWFLEHRHRATEAEALYRRNLVGAQRIYGETDRYTPDTQYGLASVLHAEGKFEEAIDHSEAALRGYRELLGDDDAWTLSAANNVAFYLAEAGRFDEALARYRRALEDMRRVYGPARRETAIAVQNLEYTLRCLGKIDEAERLLRRAYAESTGEPVVELQLLSRLSDLVRWRGRLGEAETLARCAVEKAREIPDQHACVLFAERALLRSLTARGSFDEARIKARELVDWTKEKFGERSPRLDT